VTRLAQEHQSTARAPSAPLIHRGSEPSPLSQTAAPHRGLWQSSGPPEWFVSWSGDRGGPSRRIAEQHWAHCHWHRSVRGAAALQVLSCLLLCDQQRSRSPAGANSRRGRATPQEHTRPAGRCLSRRELSGQQWAKAGIHADHERGGRTSSIHERSSLLEARPRSSGFAPCHDS
jgi:hypothetical protein